MSEASVVNPADLRTIPSKPEENFYTHEKGILS
jgi:hypothetical protein